MCHNGGEDSATAGPTHSPLHPALEGETVIMCLHQGELSLAVEGVLVAVQGDNVRVTKHTGCVGWVGEGMRGGGGGEGMREQRKKGH